MGVRSVKKGDIRCDYCDKQLAIIEASSKVFVTLEEEMRFTKIKCLECSE